MSKEMGIIVLGALVLIQPFLGVPSSWHTTISVIAGIGILVLGFLLRGEALASGHRSSSRNSFVENSTATIVQDYSHEHNNIVN